MTQARQPQSSAISTPRRWFPFVLRNTHDNEAQPHIIAHEFEKKKLKIGPLLASGATGNIHRGTYDGKDVAIKLFREIGPKAEKEFASRQFLQEVATLSTMQCPYIVQFVGSFEDEDCHGIVTEFMCGGNLNHYMRKYHKRMSQLQVLKMAVDIARGMSYLHSKNLIHRDLKSDNILVDAMGNVKVADFSDSKFVNNNQDMTAEAGTCRWMAPEVILGKQYDTRVDVYSFGIILWELVTGQTPFEGLSPVQVAFNVVTKTLRPTIPESCPSELRALISRCWMANPSRRPVFF